MECEYPPAPTIPACFHLGAKLILAIMPPEASDPWRITSSAEAPLFSAAEKPTMHKLLPAIAPTVSEVKPANATVSAGMKTAFGLRIRVLLARVRRREQATHLLHRLGMAGGLGIRVFRHELLVTLE